MIRDGRKLRRYKEMEPMYLQVLQKETGRQIKKLLVENGYTVKDVQNAMGFENPQAVYKWISGRSLPSLDNFVILSRLLHTSIEDILVIDGDITILREGDTQWIMYGIKQIFGTKEKDHGRYLVWCCGI